MVRVANITTAVEVARYLSERIANSKVVCYHSNHFPMQRFHIERRLAFLLTRKAVNPNKHILDDTEVRQILDGAEGDVQLIVVATPVEEIGRDHDFDWAIIEPSSSQSIVQAAGRVNRHRLARIPADRPNVAILQYCYREVDGKQCVFTKPGLEMMIASSAAAEQSSHSSHDLSDLFDWSRLDQIDARMRFCSDIHPFAEYDDKAIEEQSKRIMDSMLTVDNLWMARETYTESRLRDFSSTIELGLDNPESPKEYNVSSKDIFDGKEEKETIDIRKRASNDWLIKTDQELIDDAQENGMNDKKAMTVSISCFSKNGQTPATFARKNVSRHLSFGFFIPR